MSSFFIAPIVEGHGEVQAVPVLLNRILSQRAPHSQLHVNEPLRVKVGSFLKDGEYFRKYIELATRKAKLRQNGSVLILLDCEDDCAAQLGPQITQRARAIRSDVPITVALAYREYETWFLAAANSLRGVAGLDGNLQPPTDPEGIRDAKGWLSSRMQFPYNETNDQRELTSVFSFAEASVVPSFRRLHRKMSDLFST